MTGWSVELFNRVWVRSIIGGDQEESDVPPILHGCHLAKKDVENV